MRKFLPLVITLFLFAATNVFALGEARMAGRILDAATKEPIENAVVTADALEDRTIHQEFKAKKNGSYALFLLYGTIKYKFTVSAPGYEPYVESMKLALGDTNAKDFFLSKSGAAVADVPATRKSDPSVDAYNAGAQLANNGDLDGAIAKFEEAVAAKPDFLAGWMAIAKTAGKAKKYPKAIEAAKKVVEVDAEDTEMWGVLFNAYTATGDKANAAIAEQKMPASADSLFNQAAGAINEGNDAKAEGLLKRAIEVDAQMTQAHYELGMVYVRTGKNAEAKAALMKYLELEPNGKDAATAKEMLPYLK